MHLILLLIASCHALTCSTTIQIIEDTCSTTTQIIDDTWCDPCNLRHSEICKNSCIELFKYNTCINNTISVPHAKIIYPNYEYHNYKRVIYCYALITNIIVLILMEYYVILK